MYFSKHIKNNGFVGNYICTYIHVHNQETNLTSHGFSCMYICTSHNRTDTLETNAGREIKKLREKKREKESVSVFSLSYD